MIAWDIVVYATGFVVIGMALAFLLMLVAVAHVLFVASREEAHRRQMEMLEKAIDLARLTGELPADAAPRVLAPS